MKRFLAASRFAVLLAIFGSLIVAATLLVVGLLQAFNLVDAAFLREKNIKQLALDGIVLVDVLLLGTVFLIIALGLFALFIDDTVPVPAWLEIHTLDDLKVKLLNIVVVVLAVTFLGSVVSWNGKPEILHIGAAIGIVISAITYFLSKMK